MVHYYSEAVRGVQDNVPGVTVDSRQLCYIAEMHHGIGHRVTVEI